MWIVSAYILICIVRHIGYDHQRDTRRGRPWSRFNQDTANQAKVRRFVPTYENIEFTWSQELVAPWTQVLTVESTLFIPIDVVMGSFDGIRFTIELGKDSSCTKILTDRCHNSRCTNCPHHRMDSIIAQARSLVLAPQRRRSVDGWMDGRSVCRMISSPTRRRSIRSDIHSSYPMLTMPPLPSQIWIFLTNDLRMAWNPLETENASGVAGTHAWMDGCCVVVVVRWSRWLAIRRVPLHLHFEPLSLGCSRLSWEIRSWPRLAPTYGERVYYV